MAHSPSVESVPAPGIVVVGHPAAVLRELARQEPQPPVCAICGVEFRLERVRYGRDSADLWTCPVVSSHSARAAA